MIEGSFDSRTLTKMNMALDRVCRTLPNGEDHAVRKRVAEKIVACASRGSTTLDELAAAGAHLDRETEMRPAAARSTGR
ncbi:MAG: hypothetical protein JOY90_07525 [Bradyrhizobium sp.]|uniref:hypothetical protein n=1 Tax=Bradyrhizobium sp. TaxID=376 RepID=UPI001D33585F|nr:hypothetical protein [Bradyrhizobium sp.]MBV9560297.1 hypothetical protein [Bradyrhizobium sp.]